VKKKPRVSTTTLVFPGPSGWRVRLPSGQTQTVAALDAAAAALPPGGTVHLALPCHAALLERMTLPSTDREELSGMVQLQLEKTLPYPVEEVSTSFDVLSQAENESTLLSVAANHSQLDLMCEPLRSKAFVPQKVTLYAQHVAASCPADETVLCLWPEDESIVVAMCENGKLGYAQTLPTAEPAVIAGELPSLLLRAEMEGVPTDFARIRIEQGCGGLRDMLADHFGKPVEIFSFDAPLPEPPANLAPASWALETRRLENADQTKSRLQLVAMAYLILIAAAFVYLAVLKKRVQNLDGKIATTQPLVEFQQSRQAKWDTLAPAIQPDRYPLEILRQVFENRPSKDVSFTAFDMQTPRQFRIDLEAPNLSLWTDFTDALRKHPKLSKFKLETPQPKILPDGRVQFTITGKI
jgi:hypothetical protein